MGEKLIDKEEIVSATKEYVQLLKEVALSLGVHHMVSMYIRESQNGVAYVHVPHGGRIGNDLVSVIHEMLQYEWEVLLTHVECSLNSAADVIGDMLFSGSRDCGSGRLSRQSYAC
ncbi:hypothetical protein V6N13_068367 [Hibiscus sabdariffa]